jgi:cleavage and polyadenylation specificity factor subunit 1
MDSMMAGLPYCFVYLDDILVASSSPQQHLGHLREVLACLQEHGLVLNVGKCQFGVPEIDYLGHKISASGVLPMQSKVRAIRDFPQPKQTQQLQTFLGMANFYRRFIPAAALVLRPLTDAVKGRKSKQLAWGDEMVAAFKEVKKLPM